MVTGTRPAAGGWTAAEVAHLAELTRETERLIEQAPRRPLTAHERDGFVAIGRALSTIGVRLRFLAADSDAAAVRAILTPPAPGGPS